MSAGKWWKAFLFVLLTLPIASVASGQSHSTTTRLGIPQANSFPVFAASSAIDAGVVVKAGIRYRYEEGRIKSIEKQSGFRTMFSYDKNGWLEKIVLSSGAVQIPQYNDEGRLVALLSSTGVQLSFAASKLGPGKIHLLKRSIDQRVVGRRVVLRPLHPIGAAAPDISQFLIAVSGWEEDVPLLTSEEDDPCEKKDCPIVEVPGDPDAPDWGPGGLPEGPDDLPPLGEPYDGGGGGGDGGGAGEYSDDGTRGKEMTNRRTKPGCYREASVLRELQSALFDSGGPVGDKLPLDIGDPNYQGWVKYQYYRPYHTWKSDSTTMVFKVNIHYMYNPSTGEVSQMKFVNSFEYGCRGLT